MKRAFVFLLLSPVAVFLAGVLIWCAFIDAKSASFGASLALILAVVTWPGSAITATLDGILSIDLSISLRAPLMACIGAALVASAIGIVLGSLPPLSVFFIVAGAVWTGACSLLGHDYRSAPQPSLRAA